MTTPSESYKKVSYDVRPAKQVERRMMLDCLQALNKGGFAIPDYQYTGFGSIFFIDFILLHKFLGISRLLSLEHDLNVKRRVRFNKPFKDIDVKFESASQAIPKLDQDLQHILWLDYDFVMDRDTLSDLRLACARLPRGSLVFVTLDVEPPNAASDDPTLVPGPKEWYAHFEDEASHFFNPGWDHSDFGKDKLLYRNIDILVNAISDAMTQRTNVEFSPLFNFVYRDGHTMLTIGGMLTGPTERDRLRSAGIENLNYVRQSLDHNPYRIRVPVFTRKERQYIDQNMPCDETWRPGKFSINRQDILDYREIYRFFPSYTEAMFD